MSYKVLYRKYRPDSFSKIIGQKNIVETLQKSVENNSFSHAYIFTGPRGTGKTSTAKVLAKAINCTNSKNGEACNKCDNCLNFATSPDIIEIDAASNNGVDEIRELRNNITLAPAASKFKIYIIDEVHMLSPGAFNALLKTLEEPPSHAIFILATTEVYKVPITILSRCQRYDFKKISKESLVSHIKNICSTENILYEEEAIEEIYSLSEGCARDALSILDQLSKTTEKITLEEVLSSYNMISNKTIKNLLDDILKGDAENIVNTIDSFENTGANAQKMIKKMISYLEKIAIDIKMKKTKEYSFNLINSLIQNLNRCYIDARINENVFTMVKLSFLELISSQEEKTVTHTQASEIANPIPKQVAKPTTEENTHQLSKTEIRVNNCFVEVNKTSLKEIVDIWNELDEKKISSLSIKDYTPVAASDKYVLFTSEEDSLANLFNIKSEEIEKTLKKKKKTVKVVAITTNDWTKEKEKYKIKLKQKVKYEYLDEPIPKDDSLEIKGQLDTLFTEKVVEIS